MSALLYIWNLVNVLILKLKLNLCHEKLEKQRNRFWNNLKIKECGPLTFLFPIIRNRAGEPKLFSQKFQKCFYKYMYIWIIYMNMIVCASYIYKSFYFKFKVMKQNQHLHDWSLRSLFVYIALVYLCGYVYFRWRQKHIWVCECKLCHTSQERRRSPISAVWHSFLLEIFSWNCKFAEYLSCWFQLG